MTKAFLTGFRELDAAMLALGNSAQAKRLGRAALRKPGKKILDAYKAGTVVKSGQLVGSETMGAKLNKRQRKLTPRPGPDEVEIHVGTADPAGIQEEFGNAHQAPHPSLRPAWDQFGGLAAVEEIGRELGPMIERAAKRGGRG
jgi:HK97 gp10 family phage protein